MHLLLPIFYLYVVLLECLSLVNSPNTSLFESTKQGTQQLGWGVFKFLVDGHLAQGRQGASAPLRFFLRSVVIVVSTFLCFPLGSPETRFVVLGSKVEELTFTEILSHVIHYPMLSISYSI